MACVGRCGDYESRPQFCKDYPQVTDFVPSGCTFSFLGAERQGSCQPEECQQDICCGYPREGGEPEGTSLDAMIGGEPCKHLTWIEITTKEASDEEVAPMEVLHSLIADALGGF
jgi:hypothetical protein